ncbi:MAG: ketoacyl-ACP synthase III [Actinomycetota bacterium]|nr:ketoacyl-ACP synthase III [Actinomycetota bacterium]
MNGTRISGVGAALPARRVTNAELARSLDLTEQWIVERTGIAERRIVSGDESGCSLATEAARRALDHAGVSASDVDWLIVATVTPDLRLPSAACLIAAALGSGAAAVDLNAGCSGFLCGLAQADALVSSGAARVVLVVGVDLMSRIIDLSDPKTGILFGDGAGAAVVTATEPPARLGPFVIHSDGGHPELLHAPAGAGKVSMVGREVYKRAVQGMVTSLEELLATAAVPLEAIDLVVAHQANGRILEAVAERLALPPEKVFSNIERYGNTSAASIPIALAEAHAQGAMREGDLIALSAFGSGFVWGAGLARWDATPNEAPALATTGGARA